MILGFTGTREGMTDVQRERVAQLLFDEHPTAVRHGDCLGADSQFHDSVLLLPWITWIETHPCNLTKWRAYRKANVVHPVKPPQDRNRDIARGSNHLYAAPQGPMAEYPRSGTWQTVRLMLSYQKDVTIIWPDGSVQSWGEQ